MMIKILRFFTLFLLLSIVFVPLSSSAKETLERYTDVRIVPERSIVGAEETLTLAVDINLAPKWHVYWKNPGDSGLPVKVQWDVPDGFTVGNIAWPTPDKISYDILANYGYYEQVTLLQTLHIPEILPQGKITLTASVDMLVCHDICIPESSTISIDLNNHDAPGTDNKAYINAAKNRLPSPIDGQFEYAESNGRLHLFLSPEPHEILDGITPEKIEFFPFDWGIINHAAAPDASIKDRTITIAHERGDQPLSDMSELSGLLVIKGERGQNKGFALTAAPKVIAQKQTEKENISEAENHIKSSQITWFHAIYFALLGGLILNLMPCVFPVLSMKALSLVKMSEKENKRARVQGIAYTLGVVLSFLAVGAVLLLLKEAGTRVGWGFQLQNPVIVGILAYLLFIIGLNLIGFFEFKSVSGNIGNKLTQGNSWSSSFFTGVLATIVATPCTAPFMGAAMGFAITQTFPVGISIFGALGFGLALPYLILSFVPPLRRFLPKPGQWMEIFKQFLAFPIFASSIWLIWVLSQQSGSYGVLLVLLGMLAIAFCVWLSHLRYKGVAKTFTTILLAICLFLPIFSLFYIKNTEQSVISSWKTYHFGIAFSDHALSQLLKGNDPIFVEMTAAWCITCKANQAIALNIKSTKALFQKHNVRYLIGDWTSYDDKITQYLDRFGRNGVPLYVFYGKRDIETGKRPEPVLLPQVLTPSIVEEVIE